MGGIHRCLCLVGAVSSVDGLLREVIKPIYLNTVDSKSVANAVAIILS